MKRPLESGPWESETYFPVVVEGEESDYMKVVVNETWKTLGKD